MLKELLLENNGTDCFVNATIKLVFHTSLVTFLHSNLAQIRKRTPNPDNLIVSQQLHELSQSQGKVSTRQVRTEVALKSGKNHLDLNSQEDAQEFLLALDNTLKTELGWTKWNGKLRIETRFSKGEKGACEGCGIPPEAREDEFDTLQVALDPSIFGSTTLSKVLADHLVENLHIKCYQCCPHGDKCDQKGACSKPATTVKSLSEAPEHLFIQLKRFYFDGNRPRKICKMVSFSVNDTFQLNSEAQYKVVGVLNHTGYSANSGHYVTYLKDTQGTNSWKKHDDDRVTPAKFNEVNTEENYIFLLKKVDENEKAQDQVLHNLNQILINEEPKQNLVETKGKIDTRSEVEIPDELDVQIKDLEVKPNKTPEDKKELRKLKNRRAQRIKRKKENEEARKKRLEKDNAAHKQSRENESLEARRKRIEKDNATHQQSRENESLEARRKRIEKQKKINQENLENESLEARRKRIEKQNKINQEILENESLDERSVRLEKDRLRHHAAKTGKTSLGRLKSFRGVVRWGQSFPCINCHQTLTRGKVLEFDSEIKGQLAESCSAALARATINQNHHNLKISFLEEVFEDDGGEEITLTSEKKTGFICKVCFNTLKGGKYPPKSATNCLAAVSVPDDLLPRTYLEEALLARALVFIKIFSLRNSLMPAMKDQCIVIPLEKGDVYNTVESMPRLPSESGIIDIQWKRRVAMKNVHLQAKVDPDKLFRQLQFLKDCGNPHYQKTQTREEYEKRCLSKDPIGYNLIFGENEVSDKLHLNFIPEAVEPIYDLEEYQELIKENKEDQEYREKDVVRKHQLDYNETLCMVEKYPEAFHVEGVIHHGHDSAVDSLLEEQEDDPNAPEQIELNGRQSKQAHNQIHIVAPGEGKTPQNLVYVLDWDAKAFWALHPDGRNNLTDQRRKKKLSDLEYFKQRLHNVDPRWRSNIHWVFSAAVYRENIDFQRNIDLG